MVNMVTVYRYDILENKKKNFKITLHCFRIHMALSQTCQDFKPCMISMKKQLKTIYLLMKLYLALI